MSDSKLWILTFAIGVVTTIGLSMMLSAALPASPGDEPVTVTKQMLADVLCLAASDNLVAFAYDTDKTTLTASPILKGRAFDNATPDRKDELAEQLRGYARDRANVAGPRVLALVHKYVDPKATLVIE